MDKIYKIPVKIGGISKIHKITFDNRKNNGESSSFRQWRIDELEKKISTPEE